MQAGCEGTPLRLEPLARGLWLVPAAPGDATAENRGQVSHLLVAVDGARTWLIGSGPSPAFGQRLACALQQQVGRRATDVVSAWPHPESVLGLAGLPGPRTWAHAAVADAMRSRCADCVERLRQRLGGAAADLGDDPVRVPDRRLVGTQGRLGPWRWHLLWRGEGLPVTAWEHRASGLRFAPGLLWGDGAPDGRDADLPTMAASIDALARWPRRKSTRWIGEQGAPLDAAAVAAQQRYWRWLLEAARRGVETGDVETVLPAPPPDLQSLAASPQHALNWQRAWRQAESRWLQRSLR